jgi:hypothetical protein
MKQHRTYKLTIPKPLAKHVAQLLFNSMSAQTYMLNPQLHQFFTEQDVKETMI